MFTELELKIQSLTAQNEALKDGNQEVINAKYIELENRAFETAKENATLKAQVE